MRTRTCTCTCSHATPIEGLLHCSARPTRTNARLTLLPQLQPPWYPRGDAQGRRTNQVIPRRHLPEPPPLQGQDRPGRWMRHLDPVHVRCQGWRKARHRRRHVHHHRQGQGDCRGQRHERQDYPAPGKDGGRRSALPPGRHHHLRVDGLLPAIREHVGHRSLGP